MRAGRETKVIQFNENVIYASPYPGWRCDHTKFTPPMMTKSLNITTHLLRDFDLLVYGRKNLSLDGFLIGLIIAKSQSETKSDSEFAHPWSPGEDWFFTIVGPA